MDKLTHLSKVHTLTLKAKALRLDGKIADALRIEQRVTDLVRQAHTNGYGDEAEEVEMIAQEP